MKKYLMLIVTVLCGLILVACKPTFKGTTVKFRVPSGVISNALQQILPEFEALHEGEIKVELEPVSGGYDGLLTKNIYDLNNKTCPTMTIGYPDHFAVYLSGNGLENLTPYMERDNFDLSDFVKAYLPENQLGDDGEGAYYGLPLNKSTEVMIYNKTVFDIMGYKVPTIWAEVETLGEQILKDCAEKKLDNLEYNDEPVLGKDDKKPSEYLSKGAFYPIAYDSTDNAFITILRQWDAKYTEKVSVSKGYAVFNEEENVNDTVEGLKYFQDLAKRKIFSVAESFDESYASNAFKNLQCLITIGSSAGVGYNVPSGDKFEIGIEPVPYRDEDHKYVISQGTNVCILSQGATQEEKEAAWKLIKFLTSVESTVKFCMSAGGYLPIRESAYEDETYKKYLQNPLYKTHADSAKAAKKYRGEELGYSMFVDPAFKGSSTIRTSVGSAFSRIIVQKEDIRTVLNETIKNLGPAYQR